MHCDNLELYPPPCSCSDIFKVGSSPIFVSLETSLFGLEKICCCSGLPRWVFCTLSKAVFYFFFGSKFGEHGEVPWVD